MRKTQNGLEYIELDSRVNPIPAIEPDAVESEIRPHFTDKAFVVAYLDDRFRMGRWEDENFFFHDGQKIHLPHLQKIRIFDREKELLFWRTGTGMKGRLRMDDFNGSGTEVVLAHQVLMGTCSADIGNGFTKISEQRAAGLTIPFGNIEVDEKKKRICIKTHNYIGENPVGQATYVDCRFVAFTDGKEALNRGV